MQSFEILCSKMLLAADTASRYRALAAFVITLKHEARDMSFSGSVTDDGSPGKVKFREDVVIRQGLLPVARIEMTFRRECKAEYFIELLGVPGGEEWGPLLTPSGELSNNSHLSTWRLGEHDPVRFGASMAEVFNSCGVFHQLKRAGHEAKCQVCPSQLVCLAGKTGGALYSA